MTLFWGTFAKGEAEHDQQVVDALWKFFESLKKWAVLHQIHRILSLDPFARPIYWKIIKVSKRHLNTWTPLHTVAHEGLAIFYEKYMRSQCPPSGGRRCDIELGNVDSENEERVTPLLSACVRGHSVVASLLIADGSDVMAKDRQHTLENTPLLKAASNGHLEVVKLLFENDAEINAMDFNEETPLHKATWGGHHEVAKPLLDNGAEINVQNSSQSTPLNKAPSRGHL